jgi:hypothetical protein
MIGLLCFALAVLTSPFKSRLVDPSEIPKLLSERRDLCLPIRIALCIRHHNADPQHPLALLRAPRAAK